nr:TniQ family protein [uncultured Roseateles sp.]
MIHADLMRDELALGYMGRLRILNDWGSHQMAMSLLRDALEAEGLLRAGCTNSGLLAHVARMSVGHFMRFHTLLPFRFVASDFGAHVPYGSPGSAGTEQVYGLTLPTAKLFACRACASEDFRRRGFSWYRRAHQVPGAEVCDEHQLPLSWVDDDDPSGEVPHVWFERGAYREVTCESGRQHGSRGETLQRYLSVCTALLDREAPADSRILNRRLAARAAALGMGIDSEDHESNLRGAIKAAAHGSWLAEYFPEIQDGVHLRGTRLGRLLRDPKCVAQGADYGLLAAVLFDDVDAAMASLFGIRKSTGRSPNPPSAVDSRQQAHHELVMSS